MEQKVEPWLRGTRTDVDAVRRGVIHALELAVEDVAHWCNGLGDEELEARPFELASIGFHLRHIARSLDRLLTYAEGQQLSERQLKALKSEMDRQGHEALFMEFAEGIEVAFARILAIVPNSYEQARQVGRRKLPTTVGALLVHCADHTQRHVGQVVTTAKIVTSLRKPK
jgi:uncharacterized damage-inducible protein DinB